MKQGTRDGKRIYTIGYEGRAIGDFLATLLALRIKVLVDVRDSGSSRKLGFSSSILERMTEKIGIEYRHVPKLGVPSADREDFRRLDTVPRARLWYRDRVAQSAEDAVSEAAGLCREGHAALLCYEQDERYCHRHPLAGVLSEITGLEVSHI